MILVKYGKKEHLQALCEGEMRFAPLSFYRRYEEGDISGIADPYEGMVIEKPENVRFDFPNGSRREYSGEITLNLDFEGTDRIPVFCMSTYKNIIEYEENKASIKEMFPSHTHCLIIDSGERFRDDVCSSLHGVLGCDVIYQDEIPFLSDRDKVWIYAFFKRSKYSYQREFRFVHSTCLINVPKIFKFDSTVTMRMESID